MILSLIVAAEVAFWLLLAAGLALRYVLRKPRAGAVVLLLLPVVDLLVLGASVVQLRRGATADFTNGLAALYVGFSLAYGPYVVRWADARAAHRWTGAPLPPKLYGRLRARHEWRMLARTVLSCAIAAVLLFALIALVGDHSRTRALDDWYLVLARICGIHLLIAGSYTLFPKKEPAAKASEERAPAPEAPEQQAAQEQAPRVPQA
ncbi:hypothetical protein [Kitasatospora sp. LaBMicrA B282]|uniref:hypothetical protein n=1 Tax=Kitasatospora sp. LaBMicrA B282 TaxID=3420949 RepID=UPI003D0BA681